MVLNSIEKITEEIEGQIKDCGQGITLEHYKFIIQKLKDETNRTKVIATMIFKCLLEKN